MNGLQRFAIFISGFIYLSRDIILLSIIGPLNLFYSVSLFLIANMTFYRTRSLLLISLFVFLFCFLLYFPPIPNYIINDGGELIFQLKTILIVWKSQDFGVPEIFYLSIIFFAQLLLVYAYRRK